MSDLYNEYKQAPNTEIKIIAVAAGSGNDIEQFKANYGIEDLEYWMDLTSNYNKLIQPGGFPFPIEVVIDRTGKIVYLANNYSAGAALKAANDAL